MPLCGCAAVFTTQRGLQKHWLQSTNPKCVSARNRMANLFALSDEDEQASEEDKDDDQEEYAMDIDPPPFAGDLYGNAYKPDDFPGFNKAPDEQSQDGKSDSEDEFSGDEEKYM